MILDHILNDLTHLWPPLSLLRKGLRVKNSTATPLTTHLLLLPLFLPGRIMFSTHHWHHFLQQPQSLRLQGSRDDN